ncbi:hypothetical protein, partial [Frankia sp. AvcI1]
MRCGTDQGLTRFMLDKRFIRENPQA